MLTTLKEYLKNETEPVAATIELITVVVTILGLGVAAQVVSDRLQIPSVMFLILAGVVVGPEGIGVITPGIFGDALPAIVGLSVAIIVFEGAFHLHLDRLYEAPRETFRLVTIGAAVSLIGTAITVRYALNAPWNVALLIGSLLVATGPTVITPIMNVVPVRNRVATTLETEGVVNDVTAAILAIVMFEYVLLETRGLLTLVREFGVRFGVGVLVGSSIAGIIWYLLRHVGTSTENTPQNARLIALIASLIMYGVAEQIASEAGIAAVAAGGFILGNTDLPYQDSIERFKGDVTLLVISFVFITLASLLSLRDLLALGVGGLVVVITIVGVIRPALVMLCTLGDRLTLNERLYISAIGPRGIIPASVATLFALELQPQNPQAATMLVGTVFLVIFTTVVFEGGLARHIAQALDVIPMRTIIIGGGRVGQALAERLEERGEEVLIIDNDEQVVESLQMDGFSARHGDGTSREVLQAVGGGNAKVVVAATPKDDVNLLSAQLAKNTFDVETVVARVNQPGNIDAFEDIDVEAISTAMSIAWSMDNVIERPAISRWMTELGRMGDVQEVEVTSNSVIGRTVSELMAELPEGCHLALLSREEMNQLPHPDDTINQGDNLTFIGRTEAVHQAIDYCTK
ncbi:putative potassium transport protein kefC (plasmid) [Haloferax mediterranei ATCC 33500]|uniref:Potassium transport protein kefC n=2 Tax=Haloferax mediterranei (strain ATCC 33500 / DSM 1411 / JCM 8866 / NBRC 14739 / NCIMB 2177 / R-4) TaxID=523841 RepID=I3RA58_HALMT|nr:putative potassium transport protein kefC [Haloferax mediterranei ATCC 33500]